MPNRATHDTLTLLTTVPLGAGAWVATQDALLTTCAVAGHLFSGLWCSADLDIAGGSYKRWGTLRFIWLPYAWAVRHRHWLSHGLVIGPVLRLAYLGLWLLPLLVVFGEDVRILIQAHVNAALLALAGFIIGGAVHTLADTVG